MKEAIKTAAPFCAFAGAFFFLFGYWATKHQDQAASAGEVIDSFLKFLGAS